jgi:hypothetical protein
MTDRREYSPALVEAGRLTCAGGVLASDTTLKASAEGDPVNPASRWGRRLTLQLKYPLARPS